MWREPQKIAPSHIYVTAEQLLAIGWTGVSASMVDDLNRVLERYGITNINSIRHFLAQCCIVPNIN